MHLTLKEIKYGCEGLGKECWAEILISDGKNDFSHKGVSNSDTADAIMYVILEALSPLNIIERKRIDRIRIQSNVFPKVKLTIFYEGMQIQGISTDADHYRALAYALVDIYNKVMADSN